MKRVYLDNAATTALADEVIDAMVEVMKCSYGNPSSTHYFGQEVKEKIETVRRKIADYLKVSPGEIIFTSCGTESNNMIIRGCVEHLGVERIITSPLEHKCVAECVRSMKKLHGTEVVYLRPNAEGDIQLQDLENALAASEKKTLVSLMHANNEIGNLIDLKVFAEVCKKYGALFHSDTVQTIGHLDLDFSEIPVDFASCSAHKFHGPKGAGFAFIRKNSGIKSLIAGGPQERSLRAGTENVSGILGLGKAMDLVMEDIQGIEKKVQEIKSYCKEQLTEKIPGVAFNGQSGNLQKSLFTVLSVRLPFHDPMIGFKLDMAGIAVSQGSACSSGASSPSMVMMTVIPEEEMQQVTPLRVSFCQHTTKEDIDALVAALVKIQAEIS